MKERLTLILSILVYALCNLRLVATPANTAAANGLLCGGGADPRCFDLAASLTATLWWLLGTAPFYAGLSLLMIVFLQRMAGDAKMPWSRRLRVFLAIGMIAGFVISVWENMGVDVWKHINLTQV
ncbi:MAG: hypothetical protein LBU39_02280 [Desulfobulbaceae bacterium]|nr:hypothetical protein [Desulfobulbaceae bacterium]